MKINEKKTEKTKEIEKFRQLMYSTTAAGRLIQAAVLKK